MRPTWSAALPCRIFVGSKQKQVLDALELAFHHREQVLREQNDHQSRSKAFLAVVVAGAKLHHSRLMSPRIAVGKYDSIVKKR
jgi:uncharacterized glyoxalase superfamily metalloenzyme YdcJ